MDGPAVRVSILCASDDIGDDSIEPWFMGASNDSSRSLPIRLAAALLAAAYTYVVITGHDAAQNPALQTESLIGTSAWNRIAGVTALLGAAILLWVAVRRLNKVGLRSRAWVWMAISTILAIGCHELLMIKTIEVVHFVQYGLLAWLLVVALGDIPTAALIAFLAGVADEVYQYSVLHASWQPYLDMNDTVMNLVGCVLAASLWSAMSPRRTAPRPYYRRPAFGVLVFVVLAVAAGFALNGLGLHADTGAFALQRWNEVAEPATYVAWSTESGRSYHRLYVWEAGILLLLVAGTFVRWPCDE